MTGVTSESCETLIEQYEPAPEAKNNGFMTVDGFTNFLMSHDCLIFDPTHSVVWMDMKQVLSLSLSIHKFSALLPLLHSLFPQNLPRRGPAGTGLSRWLRLGSQEKLSSGRDGPLRSTGEAQRDRTDG